jgi:cytoskeletal protein CcmA (bactofilin family)
MWKRDESVKPTTPAPQSPAAPTAPPHTAASDVRVREQIERDKVNIGKSVVIKGELSGSEDLTIEGHVEGKIELREDVLTIGPNGKIRAEVFAKSVIVLGEVAGNVTASEKVDIRDNGSVDGDIISPRVAIAEGAHFRGSVDMQRAAKPGQPGQPGQEKPTKAAAVKEPAAAAQPSPAGQRVGA